MAIIITDDCINCGACEPECPNNAIYEGADVIAMAQSCVGILFFLMEKMLMQMKCRNL